MKRLILLFAMLSSLARAADPSGSWEGAIDLPAAKLTIEVVLEHDDAWSGSISIPLQNLKDFALADIVVDGQQVSFAMKGIPGNPSFDGELAESGDKITGRFVQGAAKLTFNLKRKIAKPVIEATLEQRLERLARQLEERRVEFHIPGMAIAVVKDDKIVLSHGFGVSNLEEQTPVTPETLFAIGSTTKAFTATAIGMLVDESKMTWDDPVTLHLPDFKLAIDTDEAEAQVTIRDLLAHRTGFARMGLIWAAGKTSRENILKTAVKAEPWTKFRQQFHYCNVTYLAAGQAGAAAAESDWDTLIAERIFAPLGMTRSGTSYEKAQADPNLSLGYSAADPPELLPMRNVESIGPAGSINSTIVDMAQWLRFQLADGVIDGERLISKEQLEETRTRQIEMGAGVDYGFGWMLHPVSGRRLVEHGGNIDGFGAQVSLFPDDSLGFVLLTNVSATPLQSLSNQIVAETLLGDWVEEASGPPDTGQFEPYLGKYSANFGAFKDSEFTVLVKNGKLAVDVPGQMVYELKAPDANGKWYFALTDAIAISFERDGDTEGKGAVVAMTMHQGGLKFELPHVGVEHEPEIDVDEAQKYVGRYRYQDDYHFAVSIADGRLVVEIPERLTSSLRPPDADGKWQLRAIDGHAVSFAESSGGSADSMTLHRDSEEPLVMPRVAGSTSPPVANLPSVEEILALREGSGRGKAFDQLESFRVRGRVGFVNSGVEGTMSVETLGTDRFRQHLDLAESGSESHIVNGSRGWTESDFNPSKALEGKYLTQEARLASPARFQGEWRKHFDTITVLRSEEFAGRPTHVIKLTAAELPPVIVSIDAETGDLLKSEFRLLMSGMEMEIPTTMRYSDYREESGIRMAWTMTKEDDLSGRVVIQLKELEKNIELDEALFEIPTP